MLSYGHLNLTWTLTSRLCVFLRLAQYSSEELSGVARDKTELGLDLSLPDTKAGPSNIPHGVYRGSYQPVWGPVPWVSAMNPSVGKWQAI